MHIYSTQLNSYIHTYLHNLHTYQYIHKYICISKQRHAIYVYMYVYQNCQFISEFSRNDRGLTHCNYHLVGSSARDDSKCHGCIRSEIFLRLNNSTLTAGRLNGPMFFALRVLNTFISFHFVIVVVVVVAQNQDICNFCVSPTSWGCRLAYTHTYTRSYIRLYIAPYKLIYFLMQICKYVCMNIGIFVCVYAITHTCCVYVYRANFRSVCCVIDEAGNI